MDTVCALRWRYDDLLHRLQIGRTNASQHQTPYQKLFLQLNEEKMKIRQVTSPEVKFLGFGFWYRQKDAIRACTHEKSKARCKAKLKELAQRNKGQSLDVFRTKLKEYVVGWGNYFKVCDMTKFVKFTDEWFRRRIRHSIGNSGKGYGHEQEPLLS